MLIGLFDGLQLTEDPKQTSMEKCALGGGVRSHPRALVEHLKDVPIQLGELLARVQPLPSARYVVFYCADPDEDGQHYYESIDFEDAYHPQTILAYELNGKTLPIAHGAPVRLRVERQLGYKMAKYVMRVELVESVASIAGGQGGYWEDQGYEWYAGI